MLKMNLTFIDGESLAIVAEEADIYILWKNIKKGRKFFNSHQICAPHAIFALDGVCQARSEEWFVLRLIPVSLDA